MTKQEMPLYFWVEDAQLTLEKGFAALDELKCSLFDKANPDVDVYAFEYNRLVLMSNIAVDYLFNLQSQLKAIFEELKPATNTELVKKVSA